MLLDGNFGSGFLHLYAEQAKAGGLCSLLLPKQAQHNRPSDGRPCTPGDGTWRFLPPVNDAGCRAKRQACMTMFRSVLVGAGAIMGALALGFGLRLPWATALWPLPDGPLSFAFMASILAGAALPLLWIGASGALSALRGYALGFSVVNGGLAATALGVYSSTGQTSLLRFGLLAAALSALCVALLVWSPGDAGDRRPMPPALAIPFALEVGVLALVGFGLVLKIPNVLPWPLRPESSMMYGWVFLGLALYFGYTLVRRTWQHTCGQLLGFLAYDLVLVGPLLGHIFAVKPEHRLGLAVAIAIILSSGALAVYYLFINRNTRLWSAAPAHTQAASLTQDPSSTS